MGLSATSGAIDRGLDFLCICYDNEGYGNTGQQSSEATPYAARTATDSTGAGHPRGKKDLFGIWVANRPAYAATVIAAEPLDLARKIEKAKEIRGPRMILALAPCPTGWGFDPKDSIEIGRLAVRTGMISRVHMGAEHPPQPPWKRQLRTGADIPPGCRGEPIERRTGHRVFERGSRNGGFS